MPLSTHSRSINSDVSKPAPEVRSDARQHWNHRLKSVPLYGMHSTLVRGALSPKRNWYSSDVMNAQTMAFCFEASRGGAVLTWVSQNRNPPMSPSRLRYPEYCE